MSVEIADSSVASASAARRELVLMALGDSETVEAEIERMEPLGEGDFEPDGSERFLAFGPTGHGLVSWRFRLRLVTPALDFDVTLPILNALADEASRQADADDVKTCCKLACLALRLAEDDRARGRRLVVRAEPEAGCAWRLEDVDGERTGDGWQSLADVVVGFADGRSDVADKIYA